MLQAYVVPEFSGIDDKGNRLPRQPHWPVYMREAWVVVLFYDDRLVDEYCFCHGFHAEQRAEACAAEWRAGAPWALRKAA